MTLHKVEGNGGTVEVAPQEIATVEAAGGGPRDAAGCVVTLASGRKIHVRESATLVNSLRGGAQWGGFGKLPGVIER